MTKTDMRKFEGLIPPMVTPFSPFAGKELAAVKKALKMLRAEVRACA